MAASETEKTFPEGFLKINLTAEEIRTYTNEQIAKEKLLFDKIAALPEEECTVENVLIPFLRLSQTSCAISQTVSFPKSSSPHADVRDASKECTELYDKFDVEQDMRMDLYEKVKIFAERVDRSTLTPEQIKYIDRKMRDYKRNGLTLPEEQRKELEEVKKSITSLQTKYTSNLSNYKHESFYTAEQLDGMSEDWLGARKQEDGSYKLGVSYPDVFPVMRMCKVSATRLSVNKNYLSKCAETNTKILEDLIQLRSKQAKLMGYETHADYITEVRMSGSGANVREFLDDLVDKTAPLAQADYDILLNYKEEDCKTRGLEFNGKLDSEDFRYYRTMYVKKEFSVDSNAMKDYFPLAAVIRNTLDIYQELLNLTFVLRESTDVWFEDVECYAVKDNESGEVIGHFFLDNFPREGKYSHYAVFPLQKACLKVSETGFTDERQLPMCAMMCNFPKPEGNKPALVEHDDVETFFHEFGHVMHNICSLTTVALFGGTSVERDFVEAPSQMLENWCWDERMLRRLSSHYITGASLPEYLITKLIKSRHATEGLLTRRQLVFGIMDQIMHTSETCDTVQLALDKSAEIGLIRNPDGTAFNAGWGHMAGYDAQYYGYLWSQVFSADMFHTKFKADPLDKQSGAEYRKYILSVGGSIDASEMLRNFLGREPSNEAFLMDLGLGPAKEEN